MPSEIYTILQGLSSIEAPVLYIAGALFVAAFLILIIVRHIKYRSFREERRDYLLENIDKRLLEIRHTQLKREHAKRSKEEERQRQAEKPLPSIQCTDSTNQHVVAMQKAPRASGCQTARLKAVTKGLITKETAIQETMPQGVFTQESLTQEVITKDRVTQEPGKDESRQGFVIRYVTIKDAMDKQGKTYTREEIERKIRF